MQILCYMARFGGVYKADESGSSLKAVGWTKVKELPPRKSWAESSVKLKNKKDAGGQWWNSQDIMGSKALNMKYKVGNVLKAKEGHFVGGTRYTTLGWDYIVYEHANGNLYIVNDQGAVISLSTILRHVEFDIVNGIDPFDYAMGVI